MTSHRLLAELGDHIAEDGPAAHHRQMLHVSALALDVSPAAAAVLADPHASTVIRQRAMATVSAALLRRPCTDTASAAPAA